MRLPICYSCKHYHDNIDGEEYCDAFPADAFPDRVKWDGKSEECANGIKYEAEDGKDKEYVPNPDSILEKMVLVSPRRKTK